MNTRPQATTISQAELREYEALVVLGRRRDAVRRSLVERLEQGAKVQKGALAARVEIIDWQAPPTWLRLIEALGAKAVRKIRERMTSRPGRRLRVEPAADT